MDTRDWGTKLLDTRDWGTKQMNRSDWDTKLLDNREWRAKLLNTRDWRTKPMDTSDWGTKPMDTRDWGTKPMDTRDWRTNQFIPETGELNQRTPETGEITNWTPETRALNHWTPETGALIHWTINAVSQNPPPACHLLLARTLKDYEYFRDGDIIIGGVFTVNLCMKGFNQHGSFQIYICMGTTDNLNDIEEESDLPESLPQAPSSRLVPLTPEPTPQNPAPVESAPAELSTQETPPPATTTQTPTQPVPLYYKYLLTFRFAIEEINRDQTILPNISLGYHVYDSCADSKKAVKSVLQILSGPRTTVPNYSCTGQRKVAGFIGDHSSVTTVSMAQILALYRYLQISFGATSSVLNNRNLYPTFYRTIQSDQKFYLLLSKMIQFFRWTWVGIIFSDNESGNEEMQLLTQYLTMDGICVAYTIKVNNEPLQFIDNIERSNSEIIRQSSAQVIILCGTYSEHVGDRLYYLQGVLHDKTLVFGPAFGSMTYLVYHHREAFNGSLALEPSPLPVPDMRSFYESFQTISHPEDMLLAHIWLYSLRCLSRDPQMNEIHQFIYKISLHNCSETLRVTNFFSFQFKGLSDRVYKAVYLLAQALHDLHMSTGRRSDDKTALLHKYRQRLHRYLGSQKDINGNRLFYENGEFSTQYTIVNWRSLENRSHALKYVGSTNQIQNDSTFNINVEDILWKNSINKVPESQCSENCLPGTRKVSKSRIYSCCYDCVQCSPGEISNLTDSESCMKCTDLDWPNEKKDRCVPRLLEFLSYTDDTIVLVICLVSIIFCFLTFMILMTFILYQDTAIVKANNRNLSFLLLVSIMLSFLCVFLFLGHPVDLTCLLRQVSFGILFSVAVSCVLAKTVMVCIAFRATKPGSAWKRWIGSKWSNSLVLFCSSIQVIICMGWLTLAPPFPELDIHSYQGKIIVQCNEGSVIGFYSVLGYMGVLAAVSFITAFLARTLPDSFNEAKYITFSMLVFCSVWVAMIPAYLSTKGKYMVAVEIFAILTSSAGLLGCIFFPKCYIILWRPELNSRTHLLEGRSR
ncbi:vomeronasal type-2 receptor 26-like [Rhinoderma darwinii]|uniref:vomeronasal type-2 receptor 26-like n=1 Tax=Rhinoderma darwinii TaxID=43563 RepID=UPI003F67195E